MSNRRRWFRSVAWAPVVAAVLLLAALDTRGDVPEATRRSPVNQTFQFMRTGACTAWANGDKTSATAYLWAPEQCRKLRGLVVMCTNVPEHRLAGDPLIRDACAANDLGIVFCVPTFMNFNAKNDHATAAAFLQQLLDGLAERSGYAEVATVPWLPMGESGHLLMVDALVEAKPERCIAGVWIKNSHLPPKNRVTPALVIYGTSQEWDQEKIDIRTRWNDTKAYETILTQRQSHPDWPLSYVIDGGSGHFDCSQRLTTYIARYIDAAARARLSDDGSPQLKPIAIDRGYLANLPVPGHENHPAAPFLQTPAAARGVPWFFNPAAAEEAQAIARINWKAETQFVDFADAAGHAMPLNFRGIPTFAPETGPDGITFTLHGVTLDRIPDNFAAAGQPLARAPGSRRSNGSAARSPLSAMTPFRSRWTAPGASPAPTSPSATKGPTRFATPSSPAASSSTRTARECPRRSRSTRSPMRPPAPLPSPSPPEATPGCRCASTSSPGRRSSTGTSSS